MPVIPSISGFAPAPDLAGAYLSGQRLELDRARLAQEASEAAMRAQIARQQIEAQKVNNELEWNARREIAAQTAIKEDQNREVERAYNQQRLALTERQIKSQEEQATMKLKEAQRDLETRQAFLALRQRLIDQGVPEEEAAQQAFRAVGFGVPGYAGFLDPGAQRNERFNMVAGQDILGNPTRLLMTADQYRKWEMTAPPELRTNTVNQAISGMIPRTTTGTGSQGGVLKFNENTGDFDEPAATVVPARSPMAPNVPLPPPPEARGFIGTLGGTNAYQTPTASGTMIPPMPTVPNPFGMTYPEWKSWVTNSMGL